MTQAASVAFSTTLRTVVAMGLQERFNADFDALRHRKRACRERLASMQTRVAELAAQVLASILLTFACS